MAKFSDYPVYTYDEPATYNKFHGGINSDPASENLEDFELRDCLNMNYLSGSLVKRKGAKLLCKITCDDELYNVQGIFMFTFRLTYIIIAADGKLYQGIYNENTEIVLTRLHIRAELPESDNLYNPLNVFAGLNRYFTEQSNIKHDGFLVNYAAIEERYYSYNKKTLIGYYMSNGLYAKNEKGKLLYTHPVTGEPHTLEEMYDLFPGQTIDQFKLYKMPKTARYLTSVLETKPYNYVGKFNELNGKLLNIGDVVEYKDGKKYILYATENDKAYFRVESIDITNKNYWLTYDEYKEAFADAIYKYDDPISRRIQNGDAIAGVVASLTREYEIDVTHVPKLTNEDLEYSSGDVVQIEDRNGLPVVYVCIKSHYVFTNNPTDVSKWSLITEVEELIFQNYRKVQAATLNNKLYITTGTLFVEVELINNNLVAHPVSPYICNNNEVTQIGYNYLSPYPEYCRGTQDETATTSIGGLLATKQAGGFYILTPQMTFAAGESPSDYYFKWEKKLKVGEEEKWYTIISFKDAIRDAKNGINYYQVEVSDADEFMYRVSFAKSFVQETTAVKEWTYDEEVTFEEGDFCMVDTSLYKCVSKHKVNEANYGTDHVFATFIPEIKKPYYKIMVRIKVAKVINNETLYDINEYTYVENGSEFVSTDESKVDELVAELQKASPNTKYYKIQTGLYETIQEQKEIWKKIYEEEPINIYNPETNEIGKGTDLTIDEVDGEYFGSASSVLFVAPSTINDTYKIIQSCTKITKDNNKLLLYGDSYNSGAWYKTVTNNPAYISNRGSLSFKTTKNEELVAVILFNGNIVAFANSENIGGSIHLVTGQGDDYTKDEYYSPYRKSVINTTISCDNADTIQVCENILVFKYFDTLYYISSSELTNETVSVYSCNDKIKSKSQEVQIPWDDNDCYSEVTEDYYALCWKEKYSIEDNELILERPAMRIKMYYKMSYMSGNKYFYPWLRDESEYFNATSIIYIKGKPVYLYNNTLISFNENVYADLDKIYECRVHFKGVDINYPKLYKLINNVLVYYHRTQHTAIDFDLTVKNEAGHILLDSKDKRPSLQDLRALRAGDKLEDGKVRLDSTIADTKVFNTRYKFPCLLADATITSKNNQEFSISSITYNYITIETPDMTPYDLYSSIIRPKELK